MHRRIADPKARAIVPNSHCDFCVYTLCICGGTNNAEAEMWCLNSRCEHKRLPDDSYRQRQSHDRCGLKTKFMKDHENISVIKNYGIQNKNGTREQEHKRNDLTRTCNFQLSN